MSQRMKTRCAIVLALMILLSVGSFFLLQATEGSLLLSFLQATNMERPDSPKAFGAFHFGCLAGCLLLTLPTCAVAWRLSNDRRRAITDGVVFGAGVLFACMELYKQLLCFFVIGNGQYDFSIFPFQFCTLPLYLCLVAPLMGEGTAKRACYGFLALYSTVGGYLVVGYPRFYPQFTLCVHTMIWHSVMIALGGFLLIAEEIGKDFREDLLHPTVMLGGSMAVATALNLLLRPRASRAVGVLNLFYLSPYERTYFWGLRTIQDTLGWLPMFFSYGVAFFVLGAIPLWFLGRFFLKMRFRKNKL
ncbi:MAG: hypothetical protein E7620_01670 [Ruminococcaceae bacterium]|nr:hypothetical protein [Oscillospiraceae bacterium]